MRGAVSRRGILAALIAAAAPCPAFAAVKFPDFPSPGSDKLVVFGDDDLGLAIYPMTDAAEQKTYFGLDLTQAGVLPIWLSIANRSAAKRFLVDSGDVTVIHGDQSLQQAERSRSTIDDRPANATLNVATVGMAAGPIGLAASLPVLLMSGAVIARQDEIRRNLMVKQYYSRTIAPGQSADGFIYAKLGKTGLDIAGLRLRVAAKQLPAPRDSVGLSFETGFVRQADNVSRP